MSDLPERDLLAGTLALRLGFVTAEQLRLATSRGAERKPLPLEDILLEQQHVDLRTCRLLRELVDLHLELNQHDPQKCLLALQSQPDAREKSTNSLQGELDTSLENFSEDPNRTLPLPTAGGPDASKARGGLGEVSVAYDVELNREVALKQIQSQLALDAECRSRFLREARITGALEHPGIVPVYALGHYPDGRPYYAMRFIRGQSMKAAIDRLHQSDAASNVAASLEFRQLLNRFVDVCNAIEYAHSRGVLHRDLKPANIMLGKFGETLVVDWGLAKALPRDQPVLSAPGDEPSFAGTAGHEPAHTRAGSAVGTPVYMSPEQAAGSAELTAASDIYSLGATLYTLLTGRLPFAANPQDILRQVQRGEFRRPRDVKPDVPRALEAICCHAMSLIPTARYKSAGELAGDIERYLADEPVTIHREAVHERAGRWFRKHRAWALASVLSLAVIAGISTVAAAVVHQQKNRISDLAIAEAEAREWAERHLDVAQFTLHSLGEIALNIRDLPGAASSLQQSPLENAVFLYEQFLAEEPHTSRPEVLAKAHGNLGTLHVALSNDRAAEVSYRRSIATYENLLAAGGDARLRNELLLTYGNLAALLQRSLRPESWTMHNRIIDELRKLSLEQSHDLARERELARAHLNRGMHIQRLNELQRGGQDVSAHVPAPVDLQQSAIDDLREARQRFAALRESHPAQSEYLLEMAQSTNAYVTALAATAAPDPSASALANAARLLKAGSILRETRDLQQNAILQLEAAAKSGPDEIPLRASLAQALAV
jgi:eukaryotic-like serine/threonine-protein kinase